MTYKGFIGTVEYDEARIFFIALQAPLAAIDVT